MCECNGKCVFFCTGVPIRYERFSELYMKLFAGAIACAVLYALLKRMPNATSMGRENFVCFIIVTNCSVFNA